VQWDPEYSLRGAKLDHRSIQVGLSRHIIEQYIQDWTVEIRDLLPRVHKMFSYLRDGHPSGPERYCRRRSRIPLADGLARVVGASR
jgi:hypothetical protein